MLPAVQDPTISPDFVWEYVCCEADRDKQLATAEAHGFAPPTFERLERTRDFMARVYDTRKEFIKQKALAQLAVNQDEMYDLARASDKLNDKATLHNVLLRLADLDRPQQGVLGSGSGFVLTINLPGADTIRMHAAPMTIDMDPAPILAIDDDLPPTPKYLASVGNPDIVTPLLADLEMA